MAGKRNRGGGGRSRSQLPSDEESAGGDRSCDREGGQDSETELFDHYDEQLLMASDEEEEDECHYLISSERGGDGDGGDGGGGGGEQLVGGLHTSLAGGKHSPALLGDHMERKNLIKRLAGYLGAPFRRAHLRRPQHQQREADLDDISTSDFAHQHSKAAAAVADRLPAYYYESSSSSLSSPTAKHKDQRSHSRPLLLIMLFLLLIISSLMLLIRLLSLVQDERGRLGAGGGGGSPGPGPGPGPLLYSNMGTTRQDSVLSELSRRLDEAHQRQLEAERLSRWLVSTSKCHIPVLDPWHESIAGYVRKKSPLNCTQIIQESQEAEEAEARESQGTKKRSKKRKRAGRARGRQASGLTETLSYVHENKLYFTDRALEMGALKVVAAAAAAGGQVAAGVQAQQVVAPCCFRPIARKVEDDNELEPAETCLAITGQGIFPNASVIEINCPALNYTNVHSFTKHNQEEELALKRVASEKLNETNHYNVLMVGVDTISRLNGQRQLNATLSLLRKLYDTIEFAGYNKVGENTFPNLIPLLTGLKPAQLTEVQCWLAKGYTDESERADEYLDNCKYLWNYYQQVGYMTYFSEDWPAASTMNYLKPGFKNEPTTFYGRPFTLARDKLLWPKFKAIGCAACQLDRPIVEVDLENLRSFIAHNDNQLPYFAFHWINCPQHDDLNGASQVDLILEKFFANLHERLQDDKTFVIFFSDHGYRWNDFVSTRIGHYESSLPMLTIAPPKHFRDHQPALYEHLRSHQNALLTPFDLFKTFVHLRDLSSKSAAAANINVSAHKRQAEQPSGSTLTLLDSSTSGALSRGLSAVTPSGVASEGPQQPPAEATTTITQLKLDDGTTYKQKFKTFSLFDEHSRNELDRSCIEAGIPDNYCVCQQFAPVAANRTDVLGAAYYLVYGHLEARIRNNTKLCHVLDLERVHHAEIYNFETSTTSGPRTARRRRRRQVVISGSPKSLTTGKQLKTTTTSSPAGDHAQDRTVKLNYLPNREYSIMFSTKPGSGLFQEVVRFYGDNMVRCETEIERARRVVEDPWAEFEDKRKSVASMNSVCEFSVHSESLSRFNLYKDQSKCVTSNIELKKICYCNDLMH